MSYAPASPLLAQGGLPSAVSALVLVGGLTLGVTWLHAEPQPPSEASAPAPSAAPATPPPVDPSAPPSQGAQEGPQPSPPTAELSCGPTPVKVGLPTLCTLKVTHSERVSIKVTLPAGVEEGLVRPAQTLPDGQLLAERAFTVRHLELDKPLRVKGVSVTWDHVNGQSGVVALPPQRLEVVPSISSVLDPKPRTFQAPLPKAPERPEELESAKLIFWAQHGPPPLVELNWPLIIALAGLVISALGVGLGWLIRRWVEAARRARQPVVDTRPAHIIALEAFGLLQQRRLPEEGRSKEFYHELSEIIRTYLGRRLGLSGLEMTSDELRSASSGASLTGAQGLLIDQFLTDSDLVKFADVSPSLKAVDDISALALQVIESTRAREELSSPEALAEPEARPEARPEAQPKAQPEREGEA